MWSTRIPEAHAHLSTQLRHVSYAVKVVREAAGLLTDTSGYFQALTDYREGYVETIVHQFINASFHAVSNGRVLVEDLEDVYETWSEKLTARRGSAARRLLLHLLNQPAVNVAHVESVAGVALSAAQRAVEQLEGAGILKRTSSNQRNRVWIAQDAIDALDAFAERVGRRGYGTHSLRDDPLHDGLGRSVAE